MPKSEAKQSVRDEPVASIDGAPKQSGAETDTIPDLPERIAEVEQHLRAQEAAEKERLEAVAKEERDERVGLVEDDITESYDGPTSPALARAIGADASDKVAGEEGDESQLERPGRPVRVSENYRFVDDEYEAHGRF